MKRGSLLIGEPLCRFSDKLAASNTLPVQFVTFEFSANIPFNGKDRFADCRDIPYFAQVRVNTFRPCPEDDKGIIATE